MLTLTPKGHHDLSGWTEITCWQAEIVRRVDLRVASSFTDVEKPDVFTEWWTAPSERLMREVPVLREYRDRNGCRHYLANEPSEAAYEEDDEPTHPTSPSAQCRDKGRGGAVSERGAGE